MHIQNQLPAEEDVNKKIHNHRRKNHRRDPINNPEKVFKVEIAGDAVKRDHERKTPIHADDDDPENVTDKKVEDPGEATTGGKARPGDILDQIPTKPTMSMSCTSCTFEITCWTIELARTVLYNHQRRRHLKDPDKHLEEGTYNASKEMSERMLVIDNEEEPADDDPKSVQETKSKGESIDGTCKEKEDGQEDLSQFEQTRST